MPRSSAVMLLALVCCLTSPTFVDAAGGDEQSVRKSETGRPGPDKTFLENYSGGLLILSMFLTLVVTLISRVPQLLRAHLRKSEMVRLEPLKAIENGAPLPFSIAFRCYRCTISDLRKCARRSCGTRIINVTTRI